MPVNLFVRDICYAMSPGKSCNQDVSFHHNNNIVFLISSLYQPISNFFLLILFAKVVENLCLMRVKNDITNPLLTILSSYFFWNSLKVSKKC